MIVNFLLLYIDIYIYIYNLLETKIYLNMQTFNFENLRSLFILSFPDDLSPQFFLCIFFHYYPTKVILTIIIIITFFLLENL